MAVTVFEVAPRFGSLPDVEALATDVRRAYDDVLPIEAKLEDRERTYAGDGDTEPVAPPIVLWFDDESHRSTILELRVHDSLGLLHRLTRVLAEQGLDVRSARIQTLGAEVVDAFYVVDRDGGEVTDSQRRAQIEVALLAVC